MQEVLHSCIRYRVLSDIFLRGQLTLKGSVINRGLAVKVVLSQQWRGGRVAEGGGLLNRCAV